jgi:hypothetical protein
MVCRDAADWPLSAHHLSSGHIILHGLAACTLCLTCAGMNAMQLEPCRYGSLAEIGAGQEVARWFFRVGGAAGTIAKSVSA